MANAKARGRLLSQDYRDFLKEVAIIGAPVIVQSLLTSFVNMLDVFMVGQLGETAITSVAVGNQWFHLFAMIINGINAAGSIFISQYWGRKDTRNIHQYMGILIYGGAFFGTAFTAVSLGNPSMILGLYSNDPAVIEAGSEYLQIIAVSFLLFIASGVLTTGLRSIGDTHVPMKASACSVVTNGLLNYILIFGKLGLPAMGVRGAAIATLIARVVELGYTVVYVIVKQPPVVGKLGEFLRVPKENVIKYFKYGSMVLLGEVAVGTGNALYNMTYKHTGTLGQAALQVVGSVNGLAMLFCGGIGTAAAVLLGKMLGRDEFTPAKRYCKWLLGFACIVGCIVAVILSVFAPLISTLFNVQEEVRHNIIIMLYIQAAMLPIRMEVYLCIVGILRCGGDSGTCFIANFIGVWFVGLPLVYLSAAVWHLPIYIVYAMALMQDVGKFAISFPRTIKYKWMNNLT